MRVYLGIDTSCYTTSVAVCDSQGNILADERILLQVPSGEQGLKQSTALFYHIKNLPILISKTAKMMNNGSLKAIAVSSRPRLVEDSYMPVFLAGITVAESIASMFHIPLIRTSHQEGHTVAGLWSAGLMDSEKFLAVHLSGGTTELLLVRQIGRNPLKYSINILGGTMDLHAGQLVDRVGVYMGCPFPSGPELERIAKGAEDESPCVIPSAIKGLNISFSGAETKAKDYLNKGYAKSQVARALEKCIAGSLEKVIRKAIEESGINKVLIVGGVSANQYIRERLIKRLEHRAVGACVHFPYPRYSSDNAVGTSLIARSLFH